MVLIAYITVLILIETTRRIINLVELANAESLKSYLSTMYNRPVGHSWQCKVLKSY